MPFTWRGVHGMCVVGQTYAQGDRRDLATQYWRLWAENEMFGAEILRLRSEIRELEKRLQIDAE